MAEVKDQLGLKPTRKVASASAGGAAAVLITFIAGQFGVDVPPEAAAAIATLLAFVGGFYTREKA